MSGAFNRAWPRCTVAALPVLDGGVAIVWQLLRIWVNLVVVIPVGRGAYPSLKLPGLLLGWPGSVLFRPGDLLLVRRYALLRLRVVRLNLLGLLRVPGKRDCDKDDPQCTVLHDFLPPRAVFLPA